MSTRETNQNERAGKINEHAERQLRTRTLIKREIVGILFFVQIEQHTRPAQQKKKEPTTLCNRKNSYQLRAATQVRRTLSGFTAAVLSPTSFSEVVTVFHITGNPDITNNYC